MNLEDVTTASYVIDVHSVIQSHNRSLVPFKFSTMPLKKSSSLAASEQKYPLRPQIGVDLSPAIKEMFQVLQKRFFKYLTRHEIWHTTTLVESIIRATLYFTVIPRVQFKVTQISLSVEETLTAGRKFITMTRLLFKKSNLPSWGDTFEILRTDDNLWCHQNVHLLI